VARGPARERILHIFKLRQLFRGPSIEAIFGDREHRCGTFEVEESTMDTLYGVEEIMNGAFWLEMSPVEVPLWGHLNSYKLRTRRSKKIRKLQFNRTR
jgi:hypothetical protein